MTDIAIKVNNVTKVYQLYDKPQDRLKEALNPFRKSYHKKFYAIDNISFEIKKGETIGIIGRNGAGKSTLLKILTGVLTPTKGNLHINGKIASLLELGTGFNPEMSGYDNIYLNGTLMGLSNNEIDEKVDSIIEFADIGDFISQPVKAYSSGMFARLAFSVAINVNPDILIVDEALSVGDIFFQQKCNKYIKENFSDKTIILVSHDLHLLSTICDKSMLINNGELKLFDVSKNVVEEYIKVLHNISKEDGKKRLVDINETGDRKPGINWIKIDKKLLSGTKQVEIEKFFYSDVEYKEIKMMKPGTKVKVTFLVKSFNFIENIIIGYIVKDRNGNDVFGENSISLQNNIDFKDETYYNVEFEFIWPKVKPGDYTLTIGIGEGNNHNSNIVHCWANSIVVIKAFYLESVNCFFNNSINNMIINEEKI